MHSHERLLVWFIFFHKVFTWSGIRLGLGLVIFGVRDSFSILSVRCYSTAGRLVVPWGMDKMPPGQNVPRT